MAKIAATEDDVAAVEAYFKAYPQSTSTINDLMVDVAFAGKEGRSITLMRTIVRELIIRGTIESVGRAAVKGSPVLYQYVTKSDEKLASEVETASQSGEAIPEAEPEVDSMIEEVEAELEDVPDVIDPLVEIRTRIVNIETAVVEMAMNDSLGNYVQGIFARFDAMGDRLKTLEDGFSMILGLNRDLSGELDNAVTNAQAVNSILQGIRLAQNVIEESNGRALSVAQHVEDSAVANAKGADGLAASIQAASLAILSMIQDMAKLANLQEAQLKDARLVTKGLNQFADFTNNIVKANHDLTVELNRIEKLSEDTKPNVEPKSFTKIPLFKLPKAVMAAVSNWVERQSELTTGVIQVTTILEMIENVSYSEAAFGYQKVIIHFREGQDVDINTAVLVEEVSTRKGKTNLDPFSN